MADEMPGIVRNDARTLLAAMLQRVQAEVCQTGGIRVTPDAKDTTFLMQAFQLSRHAGGSFHMFW
ncbi:hypothetical protein BPY_15780 [Bifidobacterium psychraerophilum]